jgi:prepilin-type processing-associated H-X9-DG protein
MSTLRQIAAACLMHAQDRGGHLPLAGSIKVHVPAGTPISDTNRIARGLGDVSRKKYFYSRIPSLMMDVPAPWPSAIANYLSPSYRIPTDDWDRTEAALNDGRGIWKHFLCPESGTLERTTYLSGGIRYPEQQGTMLMMESYFSPQASGLQPWYIWSSNADFVFNEGALGFDGRNAATRLRGQFGKLKSPASTVLLTDGVRRPDPPAPGAFTGFRDGWQVWTPNDFNIVRPTQGVPLSGALQNFPTVSARSNFDFRRHKGKVNIAFADGHVETRSINTRDLANVWILPPK